MRKYTVVKIEDGVELEIDYIFARTLLAAARIYGFEKPYMLLDHESGCQVVTEEAGVNWECYLYIKES